MQPKMKNCIIHVGMHKTGSTSIQISLSGLNDDHFVYAKIGKGSNHSLPVFSMFSKNPSSHHMHKSLNKAQVEQYIERSKSELIKSILTARGKTLIISGEDIISLNLNALKKLRSFIAEYCDSIKIVAYVRTPYAYANSALQERLKNHDVSAFSLEDPIINYRKTFEKFDQAFGRENVTLRKFCKEKLVDGGVASDFFCETGVLLSKKNHVNFNTIMPLELTSLIFIYNNHPGNAGKKTISPKRIVELQNSYTFEGEFRLSPKVIFPAIERNKEDIAWMETRINDSLKETPPEAKEEDVSSERDLLKTRPELAKKMREYLGKAAPDIGGTNEGCPEDLISLLDALNRRDEKIRRLSRLRKKIRKLLFLPASRKLDKGILFLSAYTNWLTFSACTLTEDFPCAFSLPYC